MNRVLLWAVGTILLLAGFALVVNVDHQRHSTTAGTVLIACFACISFRELCEMSRLKGLNPAEILGFAWILLLFALTLGIQVSGIEHIPVGTIFVVLLLLRCVVVPKHSSPIDVAFTYLACTYVCLLTEITRFGFASQDEWMYWLIFLVVTSKGSGAASYVLDRTVGKHPIGSAQKTWEGLVGGVICGTLVGYAALRLWKNTGETVARDFFPPLGQVKPYLIFAAGVTLAAQVGDLVTSAIKRWAGVDRSGRLLFGFGGALDMAGSFVLSGPVAHYMMFQYLPSVMLAR